MKDGLPPAYPSSIAAWAEIIPAWRRQRREPEYFVRIMDR